MTGDCRLQGHFMAPLCAADSRSCRRITSAPLIMILQWIFILQHVWPAVYIMCRDVTRRSCDTLAQLWPAAVTLLPRDHCDVSHQYLGRPQDDAAEPRAYTTQTRGRGLLSHFRPGLGLTMNGGQKYIFKCVVLLHVWKCFWYHGRNLKLQSKVCSVPHLPSSNQG